MDIKEIDTKTKQILDYIRTLEGTTIKEFLDLEPQNDFEYLKMWFHYISFLNHQNDFIEDLLKYGYEPGKQILGHELNLAVHEFFLTELEKKKKNLSFLPKAEQYISEFDQKDQKYIRLIILGLLWMIKKDDLRLSNLLSIANKFLIPETFIFSLNQQHRLILDNVIKLDENDILGNGFFRRDITTSPLVFNIFAGLPIIEIDLPDLAAIKLAHYFNLIPEDYTPEIDLSSDDEYFEELDDDAYDDNIEDILSGLERESLYKTDDDIDETPDENTNTEGKEGIKIYKTDAEYFYAEFEYYALLSKMKDPPYNDSEETIKKYPQVAKNIRNKCDLQLKKSIQAGFTPRFEKLAKEFKLSKFEKDVMKCLISIHIFSIESFYFRIGEILKLLEKNPIKHLENKKYFKKSSKLVRSGILHIEELWNMNSSIFDCKLTVDSRLVELLTGESFDISEYIEGTYLYSSGIKMENVIMPVEEKKKVLELIHNFELIQKARKKVDFEKHFEYGNALVMLFTGPSGTGKTMLANAISNEIMKKILLFNLNNLTQISNIDDSAIFQTLFREARMNDAILFFDESEAILSSRYNDLLIEIERHTGIVIFATNAAFEIDPAMRRRILHFTNFKDPGGNLRKEIWRVHLFDFPKKLKLDKDINLELLASKFEISGGLIKNAIFTSLVKAVNESNSDDPVIKMKHLMQGAKEQLDNKYFMSKMEKVRIPHKGMESLVVTDILRDKINEIVNYEKARKVLEGQWGFSDIFPDKNGIAVLFHGPPGTGKTLAAETIAYETGKTLKQVNYVQIVSKYVGETEKALEALFLELADNKSILLFDEADALFAKRIEVNGSNSRYLNMETDLLLSLIEQNNVFAILTTNNIDNIDAAFFRRMTYILSFDKPDKYLRKALWKTLLSPKLPLKEEINFDILASKYDFTGAEIKNVIIRTATNKALKMEDNMGLTTQDFIKTCNEFIRPDELGRKRIGFS
jgi:SpoVK/Ycf46/Vps4 family AAA+-type ATPase